MNTPVLFIIFNRPDTTEKVFEKIKQAKPPRLYIAADGPRKDHPDDVEKCKNAREIATNIDWDCEIKTLFQDSNLGCGKGPVTAIDWFFDNEKKGIILEDDCIPSKSFFNFCEDLLNYYKNDSRIMHINGNNFGAKKNNFYESNYSYHFNNLAQAWGWATWRRAWSKFSFKLKNYDNFLKTDYLKKVFVKRKHLEKQIIRWNIVKNGRRDIWDFQWQFSVISNHGLSIVPKNNLVSNIGFGNDATHTTDKNSDKYKIKNYEIDFPLNHPDFIIPDRKINLWYQKNMLGNPTILRRVKNKILIAKEKFNND